jgi:hypothetical protein
MLGASYPRTRYLLPASARSVSRAPAVHRRLANTEASYYNVQLYRGSVKTLSAWPVKANLVLQKKWKFQGRKYTLTAGVYRWYVWPGFGARAAANYGEMLGFSSFTIVH